jgi:5-amino-6-(5-phospho-D-ribitylamino)uracil phosphatase
MPRVRLIAIDLDGTLLRDDKTVSARSLDAIARARHAGVHVVLASARPPRTTAGFYRQLALSTPQVNYNGAVVWDEPRGTAIDHTPLPAAVARAMVMQARSAFPDVLVHFEILNRWYTDRVDDRYQTESAKLFPPDVVAPLGTFATLDVTKLMFQGEPERMDRLAGLLRHPQAALVRTDADLLQYMHASVDKGTGLRRVCALLGVDVSESLAIGDNENDIPMLAAAGVGVAMGHARNDVRAAARYTVGTNQADGVAEAIERFAAWPS